MNIIDLLKLSYEKDASDIHIAVGYPPVMRIHKELVYLSDYGNVTADDVKKMLDSLMSETQRNIFVERREYDFSYHLPSIGRFRVNVFQASSFPAIALRRIPLEIPPMDSLGLPAITKSLIEEPKGLFLVTGPTGQGKSTSIAAMINELNKNKYLHIITIEDPIEYVFPKGRSIVMQREIGNDTWTFPNALRSALREDPDVILVGEMRDYETIATALTAADTGHLVFATLHTNSAAQSVNRIIDVFPSHQQSQVRSQLSSVLLAIFSQQLIPKSDKSGLALAVEVMINTPSIANLIREGQIQQIPSYIQSNESIGMQTMEKALKMLVDKKLISKEQGRHYAFNKENFDQISSRHGKK